MTLQITGKPTRLEKASEFFCLRCIQKKKSKIVVTCTDPYTKEAGRLCNACYGLLKS
jgi:hypothetical protein